MAKHSEKKKQRKQAKDKILIIADGITEINYIKYFIQHETNLDKHFDVVYWPHMENSLKIMRKIKHLESVYLHIFALSDRDSMSNSPITYNSFCHLSDTYSHVISGFSNPCFELWLSLHKSIRDTEVSCKDLSRNTAKFAGKDYKTNPKLFEWFKEYLHDAMRNSNQLWESWLERPKTSYSDKNPSTQVQSVMTKLYNLDKQSTKE